MGAGGPSIRPPETVLEALEEMAERNVGALVVLDDDGEVAGLVSERDYARKVILRGKVSRDTRVREIMTTEVICVSSRQSVDACMKLMTEHRVRHIPVVENGQLAGLVSIGDVVKAVIEDQQFTIEQLHHYISGRA
jgi:CBS domain-containing protein